MYRLHLPNLHLPPTCHGNTRGFTESNISDLYRDSSAYLSSAPTELHDSGPEFVTAGTDEDVMDTADDFNDLFLRNVCLFYLKLQGQFLLPASITQNIVEEIQNIHELGQTYTLSKLTSLLKNETSLSDDDISKVCQSVRESDLFSACHTGPMRTAHSRAQCFKKMFNYVKPKKVFLGRDEINEICCINIAIVLRRRLRISLSN